MTYELKVKFSFYTFTVLSKKILFLFLFNKKNLDSSFCSLQIL